MYSIVVVEDHPVMQETLVMLLGRDPSLELLRQCVSAEQALDELVELAPELVLVDVSLPGMSGLELIARLASERPELKCLVISAHSPGVYMSQARAAGARGFVRKDQPGQILKAVAAILGGGVFWDRDEGEARA